MCMTRDVRPRISNKEVTTDKKVILELRNGLGAAALNYTDGQLLQLDSELRLLVELLLEPSTRAASLIQ